MAEKMRITMTSFRDSILLSGLKFSITRRPPTKCSYPTIGFLAIPKIRDTIDMSVEAELEAFRGIVENNGKLLVDLLNMLYDNGIHDIVLADWYTADKHGQPSQSLAIGQYIEGLDLGFEIEVVYKDGRAKVNE